ncbi:MAG: GNAT family N-acetyltransferase [Chloroflexota bacterium]
MSQAYIEQTPAERADKKIEWQVRHFMDSDMPGMVALSNAVSDHYKLQQSTTEEQTRTRLNAPRTDPARQIVIVEGPRIEGVPSDMPSGYARVFYEEDEETNERMYFLSIKVHPAAEGLGLERELARQIMDVVRGYESDPDMPPRPKITVKAWALEPSSNLRTLWPSIGLAEVRQFWTMARPLDLPIDEPALVEGVNIRPYRRPQDNEEAREAFNDSFSDHWDHHPTPSEDWEFWTAQPDTRPELSWLAEIEDHPGTFAGFCIISINSEDNRKRGVQEGWIELLGTTRDWRRVGLGRALLLNGLYSLEVAGMETALLGVDSLSLTGANRLYESVGFRIRMREFGYAASLEQVRV